MLDHLTFADIAFRLVLTVVAGAVIGLDRDKGGHPAGLGTIILVCLAASLAMLEANLLLPTAGKTPGSFGQLDFMRLPLGILTGMGFLGAGAILRRGNHVSGLTTAATLWVATVIGLCLGGGQFGLGIAGTVLCVAIGFMAKRIERLLTKDHTADLVIEVEADGHLGQDIEDTLRADGFHVIGSAEVRSDRGREYRMRVRWRSKEALTRTPPVVAALMERRSVKRIGWVPADAPQSSAISD